MKNNVLVSVVMITYAHERYIEQAIESILMQDYNGEIELIVANDHSPDESDTIIKKIIEEHPRGLWIKYTNHAINIGMIANSICALQQCKGKYIALCEGDDYWTDPLKLQKQVDFLEFNENFTMCFHGVIDKCGQEFDFSCIKGFDGKDVRNFEDFLSTDGFFPRTCSTIFRNLDIIMDPIINNKSGFLTDLSVKLIPAFYGKTKYLTESMAVYRLHNTSIMAKYKKIDYLSDQISEINSLIELFNPDKRISLLFKLRTTYQFQLSGYLLLKGGYLSAFKLFFTAIKYIKYGVRSNRALLIFPGCLFWVFIPNLFRNRIAVMIGLKNPAFFTN